MPSRSLSLLLATTLAALVGACAAEPGPDPGTDDADDADDPADSDPAVDAGAIEPDAAPEEDDRELGSPREGMLEDCLAHCDAMAAATDCTAGAAPTFAACHDDCPAFTDNTVNECVDVQRAAWQCLATAAWSCSGGDIPNIAAETCTAERAAASACQ